MLFLETAAQLSGRHTFFSVFGDINVCRSQANCPSSEAEVCKTTVSIPEQAS